MSWTDVLLFQQHEGRLVGGDACERSRSGRGAGQRVAARGQDRLEDLDVRRDVVDHAAERRLITERMFHHGTRGRRPLQDAPFSVNGVVWSSVRCARPLSAF